MTTRRFTTADLENLTEGTTPGPWYTEDDGYGGFILMGSNPDRPYVYPHIGDMEKEADAKLLAAAPALSADYHRVRTELEQLLDDLAQANYGGDPDPDDYLKGEVDEAIRIGRILVRILEGTTNE